VRARLANTPLTRDGAAAWRFADALPPPKPRPGQGRRLTVDPGVLSAAIPDELDDVAARA
jgi:hypothetical protein